MSFLVTDAMELRIIEVTVSSKLTKAAYQAFIAKADDAIKKHGTIRVLFLMLGFDGWNAGPHWTDIPFETKHFADIERVAVVGEAKWENGASDFCRPFTSANIKYFEQSELSTAREWLSYSEM